jgi:hypothetical protein
MKKSWFILLAGLALSLGLGNSAPSWANAPVEEFSCAETGDKPAKGRFSIELGITSKGLLLKIGTGPAMPEMPAAIDAICPNIVPAYLESLLARWRNAFTPQTDMQAVQPCLERDKQAAHHFEIAEIYRRTGQLGSARTFYQRVHQLAPTSLLGGLAMERMTELDDRLRDAGEESEADQADTLYQNMRERTIPLGLAQTPTY